MERLGWATARSTLATDSARTTAPARGFGLGFGFGLGLTSPVKPISPKVGETTAAREAAAVGTATASSAGVAAAGAAAAGATAGSACLLSGDAEAGRLNEATRPPETASDGRGLADRLGGTGDDSRTTARRQGWSAPGARWRPEVWVGHDV